MRKMVKRERTKNSNYAFNTYKVGNVLKFVQLHTSEVHSEQLPSITLNPSRHFVHLPVFCEHYRQ